MRTSTWRLAPGWAAANIGLAGVATLAALTVPRRAGLTVAQLDAGRPAGSSIAWLGVILAVAGLANIGGGLFTGLYATRVTNRLRHDAIGSVTSRVTGDLPPAGDVTTRLLVDAEHPAAALNIGIALATGGATLALSLFTIATIDWWVFVGLVGGLALLFVVLSRFLTDTTAALHSYREGQAALADLALDAQQGAASIQAHGTWHAECARVLRPLAQVHAAGTRLWEQQAMLARRAAIFIPSTLLITLAVGGVSLTRGRIGVGDLTTLVGYTMLAVGSLDGIEALAELSAVRVGTRRLAEISGRNESVRDSWATPPHGPVSITLHDMQFGEATLGCAPARIEINAQECVLVDGPRPSTAAFVRVTSAVDTPASGMVFVGGIPQDDLAPDAHVVALATARPPRLGRSITEFLTLGLTETDTAQMREAAQRARIHHVIEALPEGYDTSLRELTMSGGELQRLGIAQALLHGSGALVLHDATSSLDAATELEVIRALRSTKGTRTLVLVSQRPALGKVADRCVDLNDHRPNRTPDTIGDRR